MVAQCGFGQHDRARRSVFRRQGIELCGRGDDIAARQRGARRGDPRRRFELRILRRLCQQLFCLRIATVMQCVDTVAKTIDVTNGSWFYRLSYDTDDTFNTGSTLVAIGAFESAISAKAVPAIGGGAELTVDYAAGVGANVFRLN